MRRIVISASVAVALAGLVFFATGASNGSGSGGNPTYKLLLDNAFGLTTGEQMKVAGVPAGKVTKIDLPQKCIGGNTSYCHALITFQINQTGFGSFHRDAFCESRPQSLIGEYFINCNPGNSGPVLKSNSTIPITQTQSTIPGDLLQAVMRMPYRERLTVIINELGAAVAGNSQNLQAALDRAVPALTETDNLLNLLANDSHTLQDLTVTANNLVTALANGSDQIKRFIAEANTAATDTATQQVALKATFRNLPPFLEQLRPALAKLGTALNANEPALVNLNASAGSLDRFLKDLPPFANASRIALTCGENGQPGCPGGGVSLGTASVTGKKAVVAAQPTVAKLNQFAGPDNCSGRVLNCTPELAQNLSIVLHDLDDRGRATEKDPRSPNGQGFTGLESVLQYVFEQTLNLDYLGPWGHVQAIDSFVSPPCSPLATPGTIATNVKQFGPSYRSCYSWLGPNQPGVNSPDPSSPGTCPPDPGGQPTYAPTGSQPSQSGCTASAASRSASAATGSNSTQQAAPSATTASSSSANGGSSPTPSASSGSQSGATPSSSSVGPLLGATSGAGSTPTPAASPSSAPSSSTSSGTTTSPNQAQQLLNYLLSP